MRRPAEGKIRILHRDATFVAVHKPAGLVVHRTALAPEADPLLQQVRDALGQRVYPVHRLDRATAGIVVFGLSSDAARLLALAMAGTGSRKAYWAVVRGWPADEGVIDHPLADLDTGMRRDAATGFRTLARGELPMPVGRFATARYALLEVVPRTGRQHQIRRHLKHAAHPVVGDTTYGKGEHNRLFRALFGEQRLWLLAHSLDLPHPVSGERLRLEAALDAGWRALLARFGWEGSAYRASTSASTCSACPLGFTS